MLNVHLDGGVGTWTKRLEEEERRGAYMIN